MEWNFFHLWQVFFGLKDALIYIRNEFDKHFFKKKLTILENLVF